MKTSVFASALVLLGCLSATAADMATKTVPVRPTEKISLFNGKDFSGWTKVITAEPGCNPDVTWSISDGVIRCTGTPFGYLATQQYYADYALHVEYRWYAPTEQPNSGIFVFKTGPDNYFLPKAIETQLKKGRAGDYVLLAQATVNGLSNERIAVSPKLTTESAEKPDGEWNSVDIVVKGNTLTSTINGILQNKGIYAYTDIGQICLQSEGGAVEFRNIVIEPAP
ncbi:MAG: DUF1080 domain-containing protein [Verrucomicrobiota bacterium]|jgi:hypothetical protein|nr:DUF1080 domain-containing protein [Verrucomicrobiota bacterium]